MRRAPLLLTLALAVAAGGLTGCRAGDAAATFGGASAPFQAVRPDGTPPATWDGMALDVNNHAGSVVVEVQPWRVDPLIEARPRWKKWDRHENFSDDNPPVQVLSAYEAGPDGLSVLRIVTTPNEGAPPRTATDLVIALPAVNGVRVTNTWGSVELVGVGGALTVDNGRGNQRGGRIEVRTSQPLREPVALVTTEGRVSVILTKASSGELDLFTQGGEALFSSPHGNFAQVVPGKGRWRGVWNGGANPFIVRSGGGEVRVLVTENPEMYSVADGWASTVGR